MSIIWERSIVVEVADLTITEPKIEIDLKREVSSTPVTGSVAIYNLSEEHEHQIYERGRDLTISAGYGGRPSVLFDGVVQKVERERAELRRITRVTLGGKLAAVDTLSGISIRSYDRPTAIRTIARDIIADLNRGKPSSARFSLGPLDALPADEERPWAVSASVSTALDLLVRGIRDVNWYEEDGTIYFSMAKQEIAGGETIALSPETGLLETPTVTDEGARCKAFLLPRARLGAKLELESAALSGTYKIVSLLHRGDNWDGELMTELELREL